MGWVAVDDGLPDHPKIVALGTDAPLGFALYVASLCWSGQHGTDGYIPREMVGRLVPHVQNRAGVRLALSLTRVGLYEANGSGWLVHDWSDFQRTKAERDHLRRSRQEAGRKGGLAKAAREQANRLANATANAIAPVIATVPDLTRHTEQESAAPPHYASCPDCMTDPKFSSGGKPVASLLLIAFEDKFGIPAATDLGEFWQHVTDGCIRNCPKNRKQLTWCVEHLELKIADKGASTWPRSRVLKMALLDDRRAAK